MFHNFMMGFVVALHQVAYSFDKVIQLFIYLAYTQKSKIRIRGHIFG